MPITDLKVLAVDPGSKQLGVAVLQGDDLLYYGVKVVRRFKTARGQLGEVRRIVKHLIDQHRPDVLAIEKVIVIQKSAGFLAVIAEEIKATAARSGLTLYEYAPADVRHFICQTDRPTKQATAKQIVSQYIELFRYQDNRSPWEQIYYAHMFDAIAVGLTCAHELAD